MAVSQRDDVQLLHVDAQLVIVSKPAGLLSVPGRGPDKQDCVVARLQAQFADIRAVHRLDQATSGLLLLARDGATLAALSQQFATRSVSKRYEAVVWGNLPEHAGLIDVPLIADWPNRPRQKACTQSGKAAQTHYQKLSSGEHTTRVALTPITGRSHQLRLHMSLLGHPIIGCPLYAHAAARNAGDRLMLHATALSFRHPHSGQRCDYVSEPPF